MANTVTSQGGIMDGMADDLIIKWAWRHGALQSDTYDTLDDAVRSAYWASEEGDEAVDSIEVVRADGTREVLDSDAVHRLMEPRARAATEAYRARPKTTVVLDLKGPGGEWGPHSNHVERGKAEAEAERFRRVLGPDRVRLRSI